MPLKNRAVSHLRLRGAYLLFVVGLLVLSATAASMAVAVIQPETGVQWDTRSGRVTAVSGPAADRAEVRVGDRLVTVDGLSFPDLPNAGHSKRPGDTLSLTIDRDGERHTVSLTLQPAAPSTVGERVIPIAIGFGFGLIGLGAYVLSRRRFPAALLALECLAVAGALAAGTLSTFKIPLASRLFNASLVWVAVLGMHLHLVFPTVHSGRAERTIRRLAYGLAGLFTLFFLFPAWSAWRWQPWYPGLQWGIQLGLALSLLGQIALLVRATRSSRPLARRHSRLLTAGAGLGVAPFLLMALLPHLLTGSPWWPYQYTFPFTLILPLAYGYALSRERLSRWDRTISRVLTVFCTAILLFGAFGLAVQQLEPPAIPWLRLHLQSAILALAAGLAFWPLARIARRWTEWILFDVRYDYAGVMAALSEPLARTLDRPRLRYLLVETLAQVMPFEGAALLLGREEDESLCLQPPATLPAESYPPLPGSGALAAALVVQDGPLTAAELDRRLAGTSLLPAEAAWLHGEGIETLLPLVRENELLGLLLLGPRAGGDVLDGEDRRILQAVALQAALAAENVRLADGLRASRSELAQAHGQLLAAREEERRRLGWALHDGPIQDLLVISHRLAALETEAEEHTQVLVELRRAVVSQVHRLRELYAELRPGTLDELGLCQAVRALAIECEETHGFSVALDVHGNMAQMSDEAEVTLFRTAQEALANAARHAGAKHVRLAMMCDGQGVALTVVDDGQGFRVPGRLSTLARTGHFGLLGLEERLERLGGWLDVRSRPGAGTRVQAWLPIEEPRSQSPKRSGAGGGAL